MAMRRAAMVCANVISCLMTSVLFITPGKQQTATSRVFPERSSQSLDVLLGSCTRYRCSFVRDCQQQSVALSCRHSSFSSPVVVQVPNSDCLNTSLFLMGHLLFSSGWFSIKPISVLLIYFPCLSLSSPQLLLHLTIDSEVLRVNCCSSAIPPHMATDLSCSLAW